MSDYQSFLESKRVTTTDVGFAVSGDLHASLFPFQRRIVRWALHLAPEELDQLMFSAGHVPPSLQKLGANDSTIAAVQRLLTDDRLSPECRADFRAVVETMAIRWTAAAGASPSRPLPAKERRVTITGVISAAEAGR